MFRVERVAFPARMTYTRRMDSTSILQEKHSSYGATEPEVNTPVSEEVQRMAHEAVKNFHECFWWWNTESPIITRDDVREVIRTLRMSGGHRAWWAAQRIHKCL